MQTSAPELTDISDESEATLADYGPDVRKPGSYAANCLLGRRLIERGVRSRQLPNQCRDVDQPTAALMKDLKQRGLLDDTLVMFVTEFGRTVFSQGHLGDPGMGRDHHGRCFTVWLAGAGVRSGMEYGKTDDFCYNIAENPVHLRDLHATMLHILGIDHERFTYKFRGLDVRLTGVEPAHVVDGILA
jgi:arylsulfatase A-like enzyme